MIKTRINDLVEKHGSLRAAARVLRVDVSYLSRLRDGSKTNPSGSVLKRLGLRRIVSISYEDIKAKAGRK